MVIKKRILLSMCLAVCAAPFPVSHAAPFTTIYRFPPDGSQGATPEGELYLGNDGNFYGTTSLGGAMNHGTVFKLAPGGTETVLHSFAGGPADSANAESSLITDRVGNLYGVTVNGGANYMCGTIFEVAPACVETVIHPFDDTGGYQPGGLTFDASGKLYGVTSEDGSNKPVNAGTIFSMLP